MDLVEIRGRSLGGSASSSMKGRTGSYVPEGFAHGFLTLDAAEVTYLMGSRYVAERSRRVRYDDPAFGLVGRPPPPSCRSATSRFLPSSMKRVLVTGASGFIGRRTLLHLAERGYEVHAVGSTRVAAAPGAAWHRLRPARPGRAADVRRRGTSDALAASGLVRGDRNILDVGQESLLGRQHARADPKASRSGGLRATFAGSCAEYDWAHGWCSEGTTPLAPTTLYGAAKDATRRIVEAYAATSGLATAWGRIFHLYGPDEDPRRLVPR